MTFYGGKELADAFRTVRKNTLQIAEDIPEDKYSYRPTADSWTVAQELAHIAVSTAWQHQAHAIDRLAVITVEDFGRYMARAADKEKGLTSKSQIIAALQKEGDDFVRFLEGITPQQLAERVSFPPPVQPSERTRFEMLLSAKEHEMHHRAKLMVIERLLGLVPHLTRERERRMAATAAAPQA